MIINIVNAAGKEI